jgi:hypothetical protein
MKISLIRKMLWEPRKKENGLNTAPVNSLITPTISAWGFFHLGPPRGGNGPPEVFRRRAHADAERGDLIFWRNDPTAPDYISHVAIYLGDGMMLEAPRTGLDVRVIEVRTNNLAGVVRVHTD